MKKHTKIFVLSLILLAGLSDLALAGGRGGGWHGRGFRGAYRGGGRYYGGRGYYYGGRGYYGGGYYGWPFLIPVPVPYPYPYYGGYYGGGYYPQQPQPNEGYSK
jgi:hypothetical protein